MRTAWHEKTAFEAAQALQQRTLSARDYVAACLDQIDARESDVRAFAHIAREAALARAKALDTQAIQGGMHGSSRATSRSRTRPCWPPRAGPAR